MFSCNLDFISLSIQPLSHRHLSFPIRTLPIQLNTSIHPPMSNVCAISLSIVSLSVRFRCKSSLSLLSLSLKNTSCCPRPSVTVYIPSFYSSSSYFYLLSLYRTTTTYILSRNPGTLLFLSVEFACCCF